MSDEKGSGQPCKNCGMPITFNAHKGQWVHGHAAGWRQCALHATPTTPIEGIDY